MMDDHPKAFWIVRSASYRKAKCDWSDWNISVIDGFYIACNAEITPFFERMGGVCVSRWTHEFIYVFRISEMLPHKWTRSPLVFILNDFHKTMHRLTSVSYTCDLPGLVESISLLNRYRLTRMEGGPNDVSGIKIPLQLWWIQWWTISLHRVASPQNSRINELDALVCNVHWVCHISILSIPTGMFACGWLMAVTFNEGSHVDSIWLNATLYVIT